MTIATPYILFGVATTKPERLISDRRTTRLRTENQRIHPRKKRKRQDQSEAAEKRFTGLLLSNSNSSVLTYRNPDKDEIPCRPVIFWGGGKCGSTTLAALLKHDVSGRIWDPNSQFLNTGKEICWAKDRNQGIQRWNNLTEHQCSREKGVFFVLDACPRYTRVETARRIVDYYPNGFQPELKFIMLIRDPMDRLVSDLNDRNGWVRGQEGDDATMEANERDNNKYHLKYNVEERAQDILANPGAHTSLLRLSRYGQALLHLLQVMPDPRQVLLIQTNALHLHAQEVVEEVWKHIGATFETPRRVVNLHQNQARQESLQYQSITNATRQRFQRLFHNDLCLLEFILGKSISWSWLKSPADYGDWKTTHVRSDLKVSELLQTELAQNVWIESIQEEHPHHSHSYLKKGNAMVAAEANRESDI